MADNIDMMELFFRSFLYLSDSQLNELYVQNMMEEVLEIILDTLDAISIGLQDGEEDQAELYLDFANIFLPFFLKLDSKQIQTFSEKFVYRLANQVPEHQQAYEYIAIALTYID